MTGHRGTIKKAWCLAGGVAALLAPALALTGCDGGSGDNVITRRVTLNGAQEIPARTTPATGTGIVRVNASRNEIEVTLRTTGLANVTAAHIHVGSSTENGPVIMDLFIASPTSGTFPATLTRTLRPADLKPGPLSSPSGLTVTNFDDAMDRIAEGNAYINVHTNDTVAPPNTGPGDFPGGEIRGQTNQ